MRRVIQTSNVEKPSKTKPFFLPSAKATRLPQIHNRTGQSPSYLRGRSVHKGIQGTEEVLSLKAIRPV